MATMKQVFGALKTSLATGNFTLPGLVQTLQAYAGALENAEGGGSGGGGYKRDVLVTGINDLSTIELAHPITDYDQIIIIGKSTGDGADSRISRVYDVAYLTPLIGTGARIGMTSNEWYAWYSFTNASTIAKSANSWMWLETVIGIKF